MNAPDLQPTEGASFSKESKAKSRKTYSNSKRRRRASGKSNPQAAAKLDLNPPLTKNLGKRYQCHLCVSSYSLGHNLGFHLRTKHRATWGDYLRHQESVGEPLVIGKRGRQANQSKTEE